MEREEEEEGEITDSIPICSKPNDWVCLSMFVFAAPSLYALANMAYEMKSAVQTTTTGCGQSLMPARRWPAAECGVSRSRSGLACLCNGISRSGDRDRGRPALASYGVRNPHLNPLLTSVTLALDTTCFPARANELN